MRTIETKATVTADGTLTLQVPPDIPPGEHQVVVVIDEEPVPEAERPTREFPLLHVAAWPENLSLRREDLYDDWGR